MQVCCRDRKLCVVASGVRRSSSRALSRYTAAGAKGRSCSWANCGRGITLLEHTPTVLLGAAHQSAAALICLPSAVACNVTRAALPPTPRHPQHPTCVHTPTPVQAECI